MPLQAAVSRQRIAHVSGVPTSTLFARLRLSALSAFLLLVGSGLRIALRATRPFDKMLAAGLTTIIGAQTFIIVGGVTRLVPLTGVTLPFVSYGGSSLVVNYVIIAVLLRISHTTHARERFEAFRALVPR